MQGDGRLALERILDTPLPFGLIQLLRELLRTGIVQPGIAPNPLQGEPYFEDRAADLAGRESAGLRKTGRNGSPCIDSAVICLIGFCGRTLPPKEFPSRRVLLVWGANLRSAAESTSKSFKSGGRRRQRRRSTRCPAMGSPPPLSAFTPSWRKSAYLAGFPGAGNESAVRERTSSSLCRRRSVNHSKRSWES